MKVKCWNCDGSGRIKREKPDVAVHIFTLGISWALEKIIESDSDDSRFWEDCHICDDLGYQTRNEETN
jgi:hypothetical protein